MRAFYGRFVDKDRVLTIIFSESSTIRRQKPSSSDTCQSERLKRDRLEEQLFDDYAAKNSTPTTGSIRATLSENGR
jgi:hypothetical protein